MKVDFPKFYGDDAMQWLYKAEHFFIIYSLPKDMKVPITSIHFEGKVLPWFQLLEKSNQVPNWLSIAAAIHLQFGPSQFDNPRSNIFKLVQTGSNFICF